MSNLPLARLIVESTGVGDSGGPLLFRAYVEINGERVAELPVTKASWEVDGASRMPHVTVTTIGGDGRITTRGKTEQPRRV
jgi:hypothetical protein